MISRYCEEFGCTPAVAVYELENDPEQPALFIKIVCLRSYCVAKSKVDRADKIADLEEERKDRGFEKMSDLAIEIGIKLARREAEMAADEEE